MSKTQKEKFEFLEHTADIKFRSYGISLEEAFKNAALALKEIIAEDTKIAKAARLGIKVTGKDNQALLYNFLEEFLFLLDSESFIYEDVENINIEKEDNEFVLRAEALGDLAENYTLTCHVKAITYNDMLIKHDEKKDKFICQVVLDV